MKLEIEGVLTSGYYNDMEAGNPIFINNEVIDDIIKDWLEANGHDGNLCYRSFDGDSSVKNPLKGKRVKMTFEIIDES